MDKKEERIKVTKHFLRKLKDVQESYFKNKETDYMDCFKDTQDSYTNEMLEQDLRDVLDVYIVLEILKLNDGIKDKLGIRNSSVQEAKYDKIYNYLIDGFKKNIENFDKICIEATSDYDKKDKEQDIGL